MPKQSKQGYLIYDLPIVVCEATDWVNRTVNDLARVVGGGTPDTVNADFWMPGDIRWATPTDITANEGVYLHDTERRISHAGLANSSATLLPENSILLTSRATVGERRINAVPMATNQGFASLVPRDGTPSLFLYYLVDHLRPTLCRLAAGTTYPEISRREIRKVRCLIPADPDERESIGNLLFTVDTAIATTRDRLAAYMALKSSLMQHLFVSGMPGQHHEFQKSKWVTAPSSWRVMTLNRLADIKSGFTLGRDLSGHDCVTVPYLTVINVQDGFFDLANISHTTVKRSELAGLTLAPGDVLMTEGGDRDKLGRGGLWKGEVDPCVYQNHIFRVRFRDDTYLPRLFHYLIQSPLARRYFQAHAKQTNNLCTINSRELKKFSVAIPDPTEQHEIVELLDTTEDAIGALNAKLAQHVRLKQSLLQNLLTGKVRVKMGAVA